MGQIGYSELGIAYQIPHILREPQEYGLAKVLEYIITNNFREQTLFERYVIEFLFIRMIGTEVDKYEYIRSNIEKLTTHTYYAVQFFNTVYLEILSRYEYFDFFIGLDKKMGDRTIGKYSKEYVIFNLISYFLNSPEINYGTNLCDHVSRFLINGMKVDACTTFPDPFRCIGCIAEDLTYEINDLKSSVGGTEVGKNIYEALDYFKCDVNTLYNHTYSHSIDE